MDGTESESTQSRWWIYSIKYTSAEEQTKIGNLVIKGGDFSIFPIESFQYNYASSISGAYKTPRCTCDVNNSAEECPSPFLSDVDQGGVCYDQYTRTIGGLFTIKFSGAFNRSDAAAIFSVSKNGEVKTKDIYIESKNQWVSSIMPTITTTSGTGAFTCQADRCEVTCEGQQITVSGGTSNFCTKASGVLEKQSDWSQTGGGGNAGAFKVTINKTYAGWLDVAKQYNVHCGFYEEGGYFSVWTCGDQDGNGFPAERTYYQGPFGCYPSYKWGDQGVYSNFIGVNKYTGYDKSFYTASDCSGAVSHKGSYIYTALNYYKGNRTIDFGDFPGAWTSTNTNPY